MITLEATKQIADDSPDHICPVGAIRDNFTSPGLIDEVKDGFDDEQIAMLDLGCAGGQFVVDFINRGDIGVGLEGSLVLVRRTGISITIKTCSCVTSLRTINCIRTVNLCSSTSFTLRKSLSTLLQKTLNRCSTTSLSI
jgi:hypothetical protein